MLGKGLIISTGDATEAVGEPGRGGSGGDAGADDGVELDCAGDDFVDNGDGGAGDTELGTIFTAGTDTVGDAGGGELRFASS